MNFIFDGPKGCGKTTAINELRQHLSTCEVVHSTKDTANNYPWHRLYLERGSKISNMIFDRFYFGELVYPYLENRESKINFKEIIQLQLEFSPTTMIGYSSNDNLLIARVYERDGNFGKDDAQKIVDSNHIFKYIAWLMKQYNVKNFYSFDIAKCSMLDFVKTKLEKKENV